MYNSGFRTNKKTPDGVGTVASQAAFVQKSDPSPTILSWSIQGSDDRALDPAGGQTVVVNGAGFTSGMTVTVGTTAIGAVTIVNSTQATFTSTAKAAGNYTLTMANSNGQAAILVPGLAYSTVVTWTTPAGSLGSTVETTAFAETVVASADSSITYTLASGTLPTGATLNGNGTITGTAAATDSPTTYSFAIIATDAELQDSTQSFTITVDPDSVTWVSPANGTSYSLTGNQAMANVTLNATAASGSGITYAANALPTGVSLSGATISGTPTVAETVSTLLTATANTTSRSSSETITWTVTLGDTYWPYVSLLLNGVTPTTTFINDASLNNNAVSIVADTKPNNFSPYTQGYYSNYFDGSGDSLIMSPNTAYNFGTGDFTVEFWINSTDTAATIAGQLSAGGTNWCILVTSGNLYWQNAYQASSLLYFAYVLTGKWTHIAFVRSSGTLTCYINGVVGGSIADSTNYAGTGSLYLGQGGYGDFLGSLSNFRIVKGTAVYTSAFTPPTAPLTAISGTSLLTCQSGRFIDNSSNAVTITRAGNTTVSSAVPFAPNNNYSTYGSAYFDGTGDYLTSSIGAPFGTGDFTIELWCYLPATGFVNGGALIQTTTAASGGTMQILLRPENNVYWRVYTGAGNINYDTPTPPVTDQWIHHAIVRSSGVTKYYFNGVEKGSIADTTNYTGTFCNIANYSATSPLGYIADVRIVQGTAVYTTAFTPPTAPLTPVTNTQLLTCQYNGGGNNNGFVDQSSVNNVITRFGNTTQGTFSPYSQTGWSTYYNGSNSYQYVPTNTAFAIGTADFTVEAWVYPTTSNQQYSVIFAGISYGSSSDWGLYLNESTISSAMKPSFSFANGGSAFSSGTTVSVNAWTHIAVARQGTTVRFFINGALTATTTSNASLLNSMQKGIGGGFNGNGNTLLTGYISNLRVVGGTAVYTSAFTPPTSPLAPIAGTILLTNQNNRWIDNSPNNFAITTGGTPTVQAYSPFGGVTSVPASYSNYFDGTGDYLTIADNSAFTILSNSITCEAWVYPTSFATQSAIFGRWNNADSGQRNFLITLETSGAIRQYTQTTGSGLQAPTSTITLQLNAWNHVAYVKNGNTNTTYINGVSAATIISSGEMPATTAAFSVGATSIGALAIPPAYISNVRFLNGIALYTTNFTPPTGPLTAISNTSLLTCQSATIVDNSPNYFTITASGDTKPRPFNPFGTTTTTQVAYSPSVNGGSMYFDGTGDYLTVPTSSVPAFGTGDFTIQFWVYPTVNARQDWFDCNTSSPRLLIYYSGTNIIYYSTSARITGSAMILNTWQHIAISRASGSTKMFINGVQTGSTFSDAINYVSSAIVLGKDSAGSTHVTGYMSDVQVVNGTALYTSNFYPGSAPATPTTTIGTTTYSSSLLLNGTSGGIIDYHSSNDLETVGNTQLAPQDPYGGSYYSNYFDGTGDYLTVASNAAFQLGTGDYTFETWINPTVLGVNNTNNIINIGTYLTGLLMRVYGATTGLEVYTNGTQRLTTSTGLTLGIWKHVALVRSGSACTVYINGVVNGTFTDSSSISPATATVTIGMAAHNSGEFFNGYMSNYRLIKGTAIYTTTFTPPTAPLTAVAGTSLLTCQSNTFKDNSTNNFTITKNGDAVIKSQNPFQQNTGKSLYFGTKTDTYAMRSIPSIANLPGDFTIECWVNPTDTSISTTWGVMDARSAGASASAWLICLSSYSSGWVMNMYTGTSYSGTTRVQANQWTYLAWVRSGSTLTFYVNGVAGGTATVAGAITGGTTTVVLGSKDNGLSGYGTVGYIKDLRITQGVARYTTTFTPPTTPDQTK
jgi:hypothetical protein